MPIIQKGFAGIMNLDDDNDVMPAAHHKESKNVVFRGNGVETIAQSVFGNRLIDNTGTFSLPAGTNSCVGTFYDQQKQRLFYFNYNSNGNNGIYIYNTIPKTISTLFVSGTNSSTDILNFDINIPVTSINILYGDTYNSTLDSEGDVLYWVDSLGRPSKLNIDRRIANVYASYERSYLDVAKAAPPMPIKCSYENDAAAVATTTLSATIKSKNYTTSSLIEYNVSSNSGFSNAGDNTFTATNLYDYTATISFGADFTVNTINPVLNTFKVRLLKNGSEIDSDTYTVTSVPFNISTTLTSTITISTGDIIQVDVQADADYDATAGASASITGNVATSSTTNNNLKNYLFQFIYRYVYDDGEKSVWSIGSSVPLPYQPYSLSEGSSPVNNSRIRLYMSTGNETVRKIEVGVRRAGDGFVTDYGLVTSLNKSSSVSPISNNTVYEYLFYNSSVLTPIDQAELALLFDYIPQKAKAQELLNGSTLIYGGITEGYDNPKDFVGSASSAGTTTTGLYDTPGLLFFAHQAGQPSNGNTLSVEAYITGVGINGSAGLPETIYTAQEGDYNIKLQKSDNSFVTINYSSGASTSVATILAGLAADAVSKGFTASVSNNKITVTSATTIQLQSAYVATQTNNFLFLNNKENSSVYAHATNANYKFGVVYYDEKGRTNGVTTSESMRITTEKCESGSVFPYVELQINSQPPLWAKSFSIVRTANLTYDKNLFWVSNRAFTKFVTEGSSPNTSAVSYIGIGNMADYNENIEATSGYVNYEFTPGDRIRFTQRISSNGSVTTFSTNLDFEIIGVEIDPNINGYTAEGKYIKIKYPTSFIDADFKLLEPDPIVYAGTATASEDFQNYKIQIYSFSKTNQETDTFYEIGHTYSVTNPGTANRYHVGQNQSQTAIQPALYYFITGDLFYRFRNIPTGASYSFAAGPYTQNEGAGNALQFSTIIINVWDSANAAKTISNSLYEIKSQVLPASTCSLVSTDYPNNATADYLFLNKSTTLSQTIRVRGTIPVTTVTAKNQYVVIHAKIVNASGAIIKTVLPRKTISTTNQEYSYEFDANILIPPSSRLFLMTECQGAASNSLLVGAFNIRFDVVKNSLISLVETSFSDITKTELNANSRPVIFDENSKAAFYPTLVRYGLPKVLGSTLNQTNRFYPSNMDEYDRQKGEIQRLKVRSGQLRVFQNRGVGVAGVLENMIFNAAGSGNLIQTNKLLNQIHYYQGDYGMGGLTTSLASSASSDYFVDPVRGYQLRLSQDGITPISELYKAQYYMTGLATKYVTPQNGTLGGKAKVLGMYDYFEEEYVAVFQGYSGQSNVTLAFNEKRNAYSTFYDYAPEWIISVEEKTITFRNGGLYLHDNTTNYNTFYGTSYPSSLTLVFNQNAMVKKDFNNVTQEASSVWLSSNNQDISSSLGQNSNLVASDYEEHEGLYHAAFMRDANSIGGVIDGDYLKGSWLQVKFSNNSTNLVYLSGVYLNYTISQRNF